MHDPQLHSYLERHGLLKELPRKAPTAPSDNGPDRQRRERKLSPDLPAPAAPPPQPKRWRRDGLAAARLDRFRVIPE